MKAMRLRNEYQLKAPNGEEIQFLDHETEIVAAAYAAIPGKSVDAYKKHHILVDELTAKEARAFGRAIVKIPGLTGCRLKKITTVFCELSGEPIVGKERFYQLAAVENRMAREAFEEKYGPDADADEIADP